MSKIYVGQTDLTIILDTKKDLTGVVTAEIAYRKPDGSTGAFDADISDPSKGIMQYEITSASEINMNGEWTVWAKTIDGDGKVSIGEPDTFIVYLEGN